jgi:hypothetical protein
MRSEAEPLNRRRSLGLKSPSRLCADPKVYMQAASRLFGFTAIRCARRPLSKLAARDFFLAVLPSLAKASLCESSFRSATPPRSSFASSTPLAGLSTRAVPTRGFGPHHDITNPRPLPRGHPNSSLRSVLRRSQPLDGLRRSLARRLVSSRSRVQDPSCSGDYSLRAAVLSSSATVDCSPIVVDSLSCPLAVVAASLIGRPVATKTTPRLRGFAPREGTWRPQES